YAPRESTRPGHPTRSRTIVLARATMAEQGVHPGPAEVTRPTCCRFRRSSPLFRTSASALLRFAVLLHPQIPGELEPSEQLLRGCLRQADMRLALSSPAP